MTATWSVVALAALLVAAILAATDGALFAAQHQARQRPLADPELAHRAIGMARVLAHLTAGTAFTLTTLTLGFTSTAAVLVVAVLLVAHIAIVERVARSAGSRHPGAIIARARGTVTAVELLFRPLTWLGGVVDRGLSRLLPPADDLRSQRQETAEQFRMVVAAEADVTAAEEKLLHGAFSLGDTEVQEVMIPRVDIVAIEQNAPWSEVLDRVRSSAHARLPVFRESVDDVIGILYAKDLLRAVVSQADPPEDWSTLIRSASFIPLTKTIDQQLRDFKSQQTHIAMVVDEYGGTAGLITIENILEEIVGDIRDEYDVEEAAVKQEGRGRFWVSGGLMLTELSDLLGADFQHDDVTTAAGLAYETFGRVPRPGETRLINGYKMVVERVRRRRIERLYFERLDQDGEGS